MYQVSKFSSIPYDQCLLLSRFRLSPGFPLRETHVEGSKICPDWTQCFTRYSKLTPCFEQCGARFGSLFWIPQEGHWLVRKCSPCESPAITTRRTYPTRRDLDTAELARRLIDHHVEVRNNF
jgi:hypothetical protein